MTTLWLASVLIRLKEPTPTPLASALTAPIAIKKLAETPVAQTPPGQTTPAQTPPTQSPFGQAQIGQKPPATPPGQQPVTAFPGSPMQKPARVKDMAVPPPIPAPGAADGRTIGDNAPLTADEAVRIALHQQPSLIAQQGAIMTRQGQTLQSGALLHPQLSLGAGYDDIQPLTRVMPNQPPEAPGFLTPDGVSPIYSYSSNAGVRQLIYDFNMTRNLVKQTEVLEKSAKQDLTTAQLTLADTVKTDFYNYVSAIRVVHVNEENLQNRQRQLDEAGSRYRNGIGEPSDLATAQTSKSQGIILLEQARNAAEHARIALLQQMGIDPLTPVIPADEDAPQSHESDARALTSSAMQARPEVKSALLALVAAKFGLSAAKATNLPALYAEIGVGVDGNQFPLNENVANFAIGFQVPLVDGGQRTGAIRSAQGQIATALSNYESAVLQVRTDVANAFADLKSAEQQIVAAENEVFNAREDVRVAEGRYQIGIGLFQDITTAQSLLLGAETDQESARNAVDLARTQLQRATGEMLGNLAP